MTAAALLVIRRQWIRDLFPGDRLRADAELASWEHEDRKPGWMVRGWRREVWRQELAELEARARNLQALDRFVAEACGAMKRRGREG